MLLPFLLAKNRTSGPKGHKGDNVYAGDKSPAYHQAEFFRSLFSRALHKRGCFVGKAAKAMSALFGAVALPPRDVLWVILTNNAKWPSQPESTSFVLGGAWLPLLRTHYLRRDRAGWAHACGRSGSSGRLCPLPHGPCCHPTSHSAVLAAYRICRSGNTSPPTTDSC